MRKFKAFLFIISLPVFIFELIIFKLFTIKNSSISYQAMINYFIITRGWSNAIIHFLLKKKLLKKNKFDLQINKLKKNGYLIKKNFFTKKFVSDFKKSLKKINGYWIGDKYKSKNKEKLYKKVKAAKFFYTDDDLLKLKPVQEILSNDYLFNIASKYLNAEPILYNINCWYNFPTKLPDKEAAQLWHFDMDRPKWLKIFIYLSDCNKNNGPHCFVKGTHLNGSISREILNLGYVRIQDKIINKFYKTKIKEFNFNEGDLLFEDSRGLHKGKKVISKNRLMFQIEFTSSLFGNKYNIPSIKKRDCTNNFYKKVTSKRYNYQGIKII